MIIYQPVTITQTSNRAADSTKVLAHCRLADDDLVIYEFDNQFTASNGRRFRCIEHARNFARKLQRAGYTVTKN